MSDFKPKDDDLIQAQRRTQKRKEFKTKRTIVAVAGYLVMAWMVYKIIVTQRIVPKLWDPYDILGLSRVIMVKDFGRAGADDIYRAPANRQSKSTRECRL